MPINGYELTHMSKEDRAKFIASISPSCHFCGKPVLPGTAYNMTPLDFDAHEDCYYSAWSEDVEKHPIGTPRMHRGS